MKHSLCDTCGKEYVQDEPMQTTCVSCQHKAMELSDNGYIAFLKRMREQIRDGLKLHYFDCAVIGAKETHCSWGMCSNNAEAWPEPEDHLWPDQFVTSGRVAPKRAKGGQFCPLDRRATNYTEGRFSCLGCFYHCLVFDMETPHPSREKAVRLYIEQIKRFEKLMRKERGV